MLPAWTWAQAAGDYGASLAERVDAFVRQAMDAFQDQLAVSVALSRTGRRF